MLSARAGFPVVVTARLCATHFNRHCDNGRDVVHVAFILVAMFRARKAGALKVAAARRCTSAKLRGDLEFCQ
jgi:hypothetical protein